MTIAGGCRNAPFKQPLRGSRVGAETPVLSNLYESQKMVPVRQPQTAGRSFLRSEPKRENPSGRNNVRARSQLAIARVGTNNWEIRWERAVLHYPSVNVYLRGICLELGGAPESSGEANLRHIFTVCLGNPLKTIFLGQKKRIRGWHKRWKNKWPLK